MPNDILLALKNLNKEQLNMHCSNLPAKQRLVLSLVYFEDMSFKEVGHLLDTPEKEIITLFNTAIKTLTLNSWVRSSLLAADVKRR